LNVFAAGRFGTAMVTDAWEICVGENRFFVEKGDEYL
jgi:hypothetical protein